MSGVVLASAFLVVPMLGPRALRRSSRLIWRTRYLLVSLVAVFAWGVAGEPVWDGPLAPTREGLVVALTHLGRLILVLMAVGAFLETMPVPDLLAATHGLLSPLGRLGVDCDRGVVRLMLVLRYMESLPRPRDWRTLLDMPATGTTELVEVPHYDRGWVDYVVLFLVVLGMVTIYLG